MHNVEVLHLGISPKFFEEIAAGNRGYGKHISLTIGVIVNNL